MERTQPGQGHDLAKHLASPVSTAQNVNRRAEKASSGAPEIEAELASEAARRNLRRNQTSGLEFVLQTVPWRPGDLS